MRPSYLRLMLLASIFSIPACERATPSAAPSAAIVLQGPLSADKRAALLEVIPSAAMQQSPAAVALIDRLLRKHALFLQEPALITQVMQLESFQKTQFSKEKDLGERLAGALRVRIIPETNIIELAIDSAVAGDESAMLAESVANQYLENQKKIAENAGLARSVILNNLKNRYQFRKDDLGRELRDRSVRLSIDGIGTPGRLSTKEVELGQLLQLNLELESKKMDSINATPEAAKTLDEQLKQMKERTDAAKQDLGDLTNAMNQYLVLKDEETKVGDLLRAVNNELDQISSGAAMPPLEVRWLRTPSRG